MNLLSSASLPLPPARDTALDIAQISRDYLDPFILALIGVLAGAFILKRIFS